MICSLCKEKTASNRKKFWNYYSLQNQNLQDPNPPNICIKAYTFLILMVNLILWDVLPHGFLLKKSLSLFSSQLNLLPIKLYCCLSFNFHYHGGKSPHGSGAISMNLKWEWRGMCKIQNCWQIWTVERPLANNQEANVGISRTTTGSLILPITWMNVDSSMVSK